MKTAVYRTSGDSPLVPALIELAEEGKQSVCLVELKARFDEHRNIEWSRALEQAGVHVVYGFSDLKVHAKMTLVVRREGDGLRRYVHVGTGNYHAVTARSYEDLSLFTADPEIAEDIAALFNYLTGFGRPERFRKILVAPFSLRARLIERIRAAGTAAAAGTNARIRIKLNALTDEAVIEELYAASQQGARIEIVSRSICMLRPGVPGMSENIRVRSIVGRYLEHSRVYSFEIGDETEIFLGSADLMTRNLDRRVEVLVPVEQARLRQELTAIFDSAFADTDSSWELGADGNWTRRSALQGGARARPSGQPAATREGSQPPRRRRPDTRPVKLGRSDRRARQNDRDEGGGHRRGLEHGSSAGRVGRRRPRSHASRGAHAPRAGRGVAPARPDPASQARRGRGGDGRLRADRAQARRARARDRRHGARTPG